MGASATEATRVCMGDNMPLKLFHLLDGLAVALGGLMLMAVFMSLSPAEAATGLSGLVPPESHPFLGFFGLTLATLPASRRLVRHALAPAHEMREYQAMGQALQRIALLQRVQAGNLYLTHLDDDGILNVFHGVDGLWDWLGPVYDDAALRAQLHPQLRTRLEAFSRPLNAAAGSAASPSAPRF
ncbi:hypothetical protein GALL_243080 [mine drainage metagenome]|uniref:Uncharacterized protein n=1 Tax=mine drainage metagenome TaxID=410659 RepID=A0A1J5S042_9ZZZZ